jgi:hypothetical protein
VDLSMVVDEAMVELVAVSFGSECSGMGETRDSGKGAGGVADANPWPRSRAPG